MDWGLDPDPQLTLWTRGQIREREEKSCPIYAALEGRCQVTPSVLVDPKRFTLPHCSRVFLFEVKVRVRELSKRMPGITGEKTKTQGWNVIAFFLLFFSFISERGKEPLLLGFFAVKDLFFKGCWTCQTLRRWKEEALIVSFTLSGRVHLFRESSFQDHINLA